MAFGPFKSLTQPGGMSRLKSALTARLRTQEQQRGPTGAELTSRLSGLAEEQFGKAQSRLAGAQNAAGQSALENAQRVAAMRGTSGAGFETKIRQKAQEDVSRTFGDLSTGLDVEKAGALQEAEKAGATFGEGQRQFNEQQKLQEKTLGLQTWVAKNEMKLNKMVTFINASTAFKEAGLQDKQDWQRLFRGGVLGELFGEMSPTFTAAKNSTRSSSTGNPV